MNSIEPSPEETNRAWQATLGGRYAEALELFDRILARKPSMPEFNNRGITHLLAGDPQRAWADFMSARQLAPWCAASMVGVALWQQGQRESACEDWATEMERIRSKAITHVGSRVTGDMAPLLWWASGHGGLGHWKTLAVDDLQRRWRQRDRWVVPWPGAIVSFLLGKISEADLSAA